VLPGGFDVPALALQTKVAVSYQDGNTPEVNEVLATGPGAAAAFRALSHALAHCTIYTVSSGGTTGTMSVGAMSFPALGYQSSAYALKLSADGVNAGADLVVFKVGKVYGAVDYVDIRTRDPDQAQAFVTEAMDKVEGKPTVTPTTF